MEFQVYYLESKTVESVTTLVKSQSRDVFSSLYFVQSSNSSIDVSKDQL